MKIGFLTDFKERFQAGRYVFLYLVATALFLSIWHSRVTHQFSLRAFAIFVALCAFSLIYGRLFIKLIPSSLKANGGFSMQFLCGYLVLNTVLLFLSLFTSSGIATNVSILVAAGLLILFFCPGMVETEGVHAAGFIGSDFQKQLEAQTPLGRMGQPDDIAPIAVFLASADSGWLTGETLLASGGLR